MKCTCPSLRYASPPKALGHQGEILEFLRTNGCGGSVAPKFIKKALNRHGSSRVVTADGLRCYGAAMRELGNRLGELTLSGDRSPLSWQRFR